MKRDKRQVLLLYEHNAHSTLHMFSDQRRVHRIDGQRGNVDFVHNLDIAAAQLMLHIISTFYVIPIER